MTHASTKLLCAMAVLAMAGCAAHSRPNIDAATGLPACSNPQALPNGGNRPEQSANFLPAGAKELTPGCVQSSNSQHYLTQ